jgi:hypothetical protein
MVLVRAVIEQLRSQQVIIPPLSVIEWLCAEAITRAERRLYRKLSSGLSEVQRRALASLVGRWLLVRSTTPDMDLITVICRARAYIERRGEGEL